MSALVPVSTIPPPLRSSKPAADINGFFAIVGQALQNYIKTEGAPEGVTPFYVEEFPKERLSQPDTPFDGFTFRVLEGTMASTSNTPNAPRAPIVRQTRVMNELAGYNEVTQGWWEDNTVMFETWSKANATANDLAVWFHRFLIRYAYFYKFFEAYGVKQFRFLKRFEDTVETKENQEVYKRQFAYTFRLEYLDTFIERQLTDLTINVSIGRDVQKIEIPASQSPAPVAN